MLVDDDADAREILSIVLARYGADVATAATVREARRLLSDFAPHVLVSDIGMPDEDGYSFIRSVRAAGGDLASIPSIALTAFAASADGMRARAAGFDVHLAKPADLDQVVLVAARLAERTRA